LNEIEIEIEYQFITKMHSPRVCVEIIDKVDVLFTAIFVGYFCVSFHVILKIKLFYVFSVTKCTATRRVFDA